MVLFNFWDLSVLILMCYVFGLLSFEVEAVGCPCAMSKANIYTSDTYITR